MLRILSFGVAGRRKPQDGNERLKRSKSDALRGKRAGDEELPLTQEDEEVDSVPWGTSNTHSDEGLPTLPANGSLHTLPTDGSLPSLASAGVEEKLARLRSHRVLVADVPESMYSESVVDDARSLQTTSTMIRGMPPAKGTPLPMTEENGPLMSPEVDSGDASELQSPIAEEPQSPVASAMDAAAPPTPALLAPSAVYPAMHASAHADVGNAMHAVDEEPAMAADDAADVMPVADTVEGMDDGAYVEHGEAEYPTHAAELNEEAAHTAAVPEYADAADAHGRATAGATDDAVYGTQDAIMAHDDELPAEDVAAEGTAMGDTYADEHVAEPATDMHAAAMDPTDAHNSMVDAEQVHADEPAAQHACATAATVPDTPLHADATDAVPALPDQSVVEDAAAANMPAVHDVAAAHVDATAAAADDLPAAMESTAAAVHDMPAAAAAAFQEPLATMRAVAEEPAAAMSDVAASVHEQATAATPAYEHTLSAAPAAAVSAAAAALALPTASAPVTEAATLAAAIDEPATATNAMERSAADDNTAMPAPSEPSTNRLVGPTSFHIPNLEHEESDGEGGLPTGDDVNISSAEQDMTASLMNGSSAAVSDTKAEVTVLGGQMVDAVVVATKDVASKPEALLKDANGTVTQAVNDVSTKVVEVVVPAGQQAADQALAQAGNMLQQGRALGKASLTIDTHQQQQQQDTPVAVKKTRPPTPAPQKQPGLFACFSCFSA